MGSDGSPDCEETIERLYIYLDGELTEERRLTIKAHLDDCSPCLDAYDFEMELRREVTRSPQSSCSRANYPSLPSGSLDAATPASRLTSAAPRDRRHASRR